MPVDKRDRVKRMGAKEGSIGCRTGPVVGSANGMSVGLKVKSVVGDGLGHVLGGGLGREFGCRDQLRERAKCERMTREKMAAGQRAAGQLAKSIADRGLGKGIIGAKGKWKMHK